MDPAYRLAPDDIDFIPGRYDRNSKIAQNFCSIGWWTHLHFSVNMILKIPHINEGTSEKYINIYINLFLFGAQKRNKTQFFLL